MTAVTGSRALSRETPKPVRKPVSLLLSFAARCTKRVTRRKSAGKLLAATFSVATVSIDRADRRPHYRTLQRVAALSEKRHCRRPAELPPG
uniref:Uncharacterized protein n=1 Tax=Anopheles arabiensis TaxID=7173 RepID=A0A182HL52_ANOAR